MEIGIIGVGYVGLVSGTCFSDFGHNVTCIDIDKQKIANLKKAILPIYEPGLKALINKNVAADRLSFADNYQDKIQNFDVIFVAVGTPSNNSDGGADLSIVEKVLLQLKSKVNKDQLIVLKSTVPIGTNKYLKKVMRNDDFPEIVSNPEFLREGSAIKDFMHPDRIIIGLESIRARKIMNEVYKPLYLRDFPIVYTDPETAEMIKYAANAFLATKISFINELASLSEKVGADIKEVSKGIGLDGRIGSKFLHAGPGYGGSCFPKDTRALCKIARDLGTPMSIVETVIEVNEKVKERMVKKNFRYFGGCVSGKTLTVLGITFKPNTDDMREAPSLTILPELLKMNAKIRVVDPKGYEQGKKLLEGSGVVF